MEKRNISPSIYLKVVQIGWRSASLLQFVAACCDMLACWSIVVFAWQIIFWRFLLCFGFKKSLWFLIDIYIVLLRIDELVNNKLRNTVCTQKLMTKQTELRKTPHQYKSSHNIILVGHKPGISHKPATGSYHHKVLVKNIPFISKSLTNLSHKQKKTYYNEVASFLSWR